MPVKLQIADSVGNVTFSDVEAVTKLKITRVSGSQPGVLTCTVGADGDEDSKSPPRFVPHLNIRVLEGSAGDADSGQTRKYFDGRIDVAELKEDDAAGRVWEISARDRLASLADNFIDKGRWSSSSSSGRFDSHGANDTWVANYVGDYTNNHPDTPGEYRKFIIMDLAMNVLHDGNIGISDVDVGTAPNSKRIEWNADNNAMVNILDAIRSLASADPWFTEGSTGGGGEVDGKDLAKQNFPEFSGFGGEFQIICNVKDDPSSKAIYFRRGDHDSVTNLGYGESAANAAFITNYIARHDFGKQGADIFSRTRIVGKGEGQYNTNASLSKAGTTDGGSSDQTEGTGIVIPGMEDRWAPLEGLFRIRRENPNPRSEPLVGEPGYEDQDDEKQAIRARALRDGAYANLYSGGGGGLSSLRGGANQGSVTIFGPPNAPDTGTPVMRAGDKTRIDIPQLGFKAGDDNAKFIIQSWTYDFPADQTTLMLARTNFVSGGAQLLNQLRNSQDSQSAHNDYYDSNWQVADQSGTVKIQHGLGVKPSKITIEAAQWDGSTHDKNNNPLPVFKSTVAVPATGWDAAQGQNHGFFVSGADMEQVTIKFAHWLAYSDGAGEWLKHDDPNTLIRIRVAP